MINGETPPAPTKAIFISKIFCWEFISIFINQSNCFVLVWKVTVAKLDRQTLLKKIVQAKQVCDTTITYSNENGKDLKLSIAKSNFSFRFT